MSFRNGIDPDNLTPLLRDLDQRLRNLETRRGFTPMLHQVGAVGEPAFENGWVNYGATTSVAGFFRDAFGVVHLQGTLKSGTVNLPAFHLPVGFRPVGDSNYSVDSNGAFGVVAVNSTNGIVQLSVGSNVYFFLDGITFAT